MDRVNPHVGFGWVMGLKWQICEKCKSCNCVSSIVDGQIRFAVRCITLMASQPLFDIYEGLGCAWVGLDTGYLSSPGSGLGWVVSVIRSLELGQ